MPLPIRVILASPRGFCAGLVRAIETVNLTLRTEGAPVYVLHDGQAYAAHILPEIRYEHAAIGNRESRVQLTQEIMRAFEPVMRQHLTQWYHFVPIWPTASDSKVCRSV